MKNKQKVTPKALLAQITALGKRVRPYTLPAFLVFVALLYGFVLLRVSTLTNAQPSENAVSSQVKAAKLTRIDENVVKQLQSLQDNSVNVQTLFDQARSNPFQ